MATPQDQIARLEAAIQAQEALRPTLGDAVVDVTLGALRQQRDVLRAAQAAQAAAPGMPAVPSVPSSDELLAQLQSYLPRELADKMRAIGRIEGERRQVTVLFADLSDFTALSETRDPEEVTALINDALKDLAAVVYQYEGYIDKFVGDAIMAVFGAPVAHEDDPERALYAALAMRERMEGVNRRWSARLGRTLHLHVGANTGLVIAGNVGSDLRLSYTVMGDTVNTASRLQDAALPNQVLVSRSTYRLAREAFAFLALDAITVKGKREPLPVYELQHARLLPGKVRGLHLDGLAPAFVGREREMAQLGEVMDDLVAGRGRIVAVAGEAGIGKSRLMAECRDEAGERVLWLEGRAFAHTTSLSYGPFLDLVRRYSGIKDDDSEADARMRLRYTVDAFFPNDAGAHALFANLLALHLTPEETAELAQLPAQALREKTFAALARLFTLLSQQQPTVIVMEDVHWADTTSLDLIEALAPLTGRLPLTLVAVLRPNVSAGLTRLLGALEARNRERFTTIPLVPLSESSGLEMVEQLLAMPDLPEKLRDLILSKAEGNPFFVEEMIRSLIERGALSRDSSGKGWAVTALIDTVAVPDNLQGVLMARLDRLPAESKWLAQQASVIGRIFLYRVLCQMAEAAGDVDTSLDRLEREELIRLSAKHPEVEYIFKHALTQEVAYESLLGPRRKELHRRVGEALEVVFADRLAEFHSIIGEHFLRGEAWDKAVDYLERAGDAATRLYAHAEARLHYTSALEALSHLPDTPSNRNRDVDLVLKHLTVSWGAENFEKNFARLTRAEAELMALSGPDGAPGSDHGSDRARLARVHYWMGRIQYMRNQLREAIGYYQQVLAVARELNDPELLAIPSSFIGQALAIQGHFAKAEPLLAQSLDPLAQVGNWVEWIRAVGFYGACVAVRGDYAAGIAQALRGVARAREMKFLTGVAISHIYLAVAYLFGGELSNMLDAAQQTIDNAEQIDAPFLLYLGYGLKSWAEGRLGRLEAARASMLRSREMGQKSSERLALSDWFAAASVETDFSVGEYETARANAEKLAGVAQAAGGVFAAALARRTWAQALAKLDPSRWDEIETHLSASASALVESRNCLEAARTREAWGILCRERGDAVAAREHFTWAATQWQSSGLPVEQARANQLLAAV